MLAEVQTIYRTFSIGDIAVLMYSTHRVVRLMGDCVLTPCTFSYRENLLQERMSTYALAQEDELSSLL